MTVLLPEQKISSEVLQLVVVEGKVNDISIHNNHFFNDRRLREYIRIEQGQTVDSGILSEDLAWINRNPFREVDVILKPGELGGTTDVEFWVDDRRPVRLYVGAENSGLESTGRGRIFAGINWGNVFSTDQILSYQFTQSTDWKRFYAHTGHWTIPLPWRHILAFFGGYSKVHPKSPVFGNQSDSGRSVQVSMRYTVPFKPMRSYLHELVWGIDFKKTDVNFIISDIPILANTANLTQIMLGYNGSYSRPHTKLTFGVEIFWSPGDILPHQSNSDYDRLRPGAKSSYIYGNGFLLPIFELPAKCSFSLHTRYQLSSANLLSSEQLGLGGYDSIRGYDERDINIDNGLLISGELRSPPLPFLSLKWKKIEDMLQLLAFLDYGLGWNHNPLRTEGFNEKRTEYLLSFGPGLRYSIGVNLTVRADWGIKLHKPRISTDQTNTRFHFGVLASY